MSEKDKKKQLNQLQDYAQEDWYKSNRTPEDARHYEFGQDLESASKENSEQSGTKASKQTKDKNALERSKSRFDQEVTNFEFGRDNYFSTNGTVNNHTGEVKMNQSDYETIASLSNMADHNNYPDDIDMEFGSEYYMGHDEESSSKKNKKDWDIQSFKAVDIWIYENKDNNTSKVIMDKTLSKN